MNSKKITGALLGLFISMAWPVISYAHVSLAKSEPANGAVLDISPKHINVWFSGKVSAEWSKVEITDASGNQIETGDISNGGDSKHLSVAMETLPSGHYDVKLNVVSGDGHRVKGSFSFSVK